MIILVDYLTLTSAETLLTLHANGEKNRSFNAYWYESL